MKLVRSKLFSAIERPVFEVHDDPNHPDFAVLVNHKTQAQAGTISRDVIATMYEEVDE